MRASTGVEGLDEMLNGGLIPGRTYLVKGGPGSGKTILSMLFLVEGAKRGENCIYVTLEEPINEVKEDMKNVGVDIDSFDNIHMFDASPSGETLFGNSFFRNLELDIPGFKAALEAKIEELKPTRIVVDPITILELASKSEVEYRRDMMSLFNIFKVHKVTALLTSEKTGVSPEDFLVSGVIEYVEYEIRGRLIRGIRIRKMRGTAFDESIRPYRITSEGIKVFSEENIFE
ncbi:RAD55 family ATPase [Archaeoglobus veneficus]|uniref:Putative circadian clock protein, KaiC n=1 Tax=Archaeoglobus veneficus (strain DSM 11195 / SNP6) TaxID=693661 RepID=F2KPQ5_ARCVS|nr:ATPase domain-containing protein [Archaeoglobus veneficus]AEA47583.1 putative circadian clock protein, KaiC [Archaeoglobus veneficus SNP6]